MKPLIEHTIHNGMAFEFWEGALKIDKLQNEITSTMLRAAKYHDQQSIKLATL